MNSNPSIESIVKSPLLSVIVPVYNAEKYLEECLGSILNQTLKDIEIILVDDLSTDGSWKICEDFVAKYPAVSAFHLDKNGGPGIARNKAIECARGEYLMFMDADDLLAPDALEKMYCFAKENELDIVRCEYGVFSDDNLTPQHWLLDFKKRQIFRDRRDLDEIAACIFGTPVRPAQRNMNLGGSACFGIFHRSLFDNGLRFPETPHMISEDFIFSYDATRAAGSLGVLPEMFYFYRSNPQSRSNVPRLDILQRAFTTAECIEEILNRDGYSKEYKELAYLYVIDITRAFIKNFFLSSKSLKELKKWFYSDKTCSPVLDRAYRNFPLELLPLKHRINFIAFYKKRFWLLYVLVKFRELIRR
ncbi:MAG: glycosyltransferase family 2 protein [Muribaculaceae bacterium]|nr:glycosyltransferase family 2 protein [Muribaculaceae bacterium]